MLYERPQDNREHVDKAGGRCAPFPTFLVVTTRPSTASSPLTLQVLFSQQLPRAPVPQEGISRSSSSGPSGSSSSKADALASSKLAWSMRLGRVGSRRAALPTPKGGQGLGLRRSPPPASQHPSHCELDVSTRPNILQTSTFKLVVWLGGRQSASGGWPSVAVCICAFCAA